MKNQEYKTKDLAEASALITNKEVLLRINRVGSVCYFVFENKEKCSKVSNDFFFGNLQVNAREFYESTIRLKNRIFL